MNSSTEELQNYCRGSGKSSPDHTLCVVTLMGAQHSTESPMAPCTVPPPAQGHRIIAPSRLEKTSKILQPSPPPPCPLSTSLRATSPPFLTTSGDGSPPPHLPGQPVPVPVHTLQSFKPCWTERGRNTALILQMGDSRHGNIK